MESKDLWKARWIGTLYLFYQLLYQESEDGQRCCTRPEVCLFYRLMEVKFVVKAASKNVRERFVYNRQQTYWAIVLDVSYSTFFEENHYLGAVPLIGYLAFVQSPVYKYLQGSFFPMFTVSVPSVLNQIQNLSSLLLY